jgi:hypothetical protein
MIIGEIQMFLTYQHMFNVWISDMQMRISLHHVIARYEAISPSKFPPKGET